MVWSCMTWSGLGFSCKIDNTMDGELYTEILKGELMDTIEYYGMEPSEVIFQHDNDPKHLQGRQIDIVKFAPQYHDLAISVPRHEPDRASMGSFGQGIEEDITHILDES